MWERNDKYSYKTIARYMKNKSLTVLIYCEFMLGIASRKQCSICLGRGKYTYSKNNLYFEHIFVKIFITILILFMSLLI